VRARDGVRAGPMDDPEKGEKLALAPRAPRRERNAEETKKRILDAAEAEFAAKGFDGARLASIARVAGIQAALIHHYFEDKDRLYRAVIERALSVMAQEVWALLSIASASIERARGERALPKEELRGLIEQFVDALLRFFATHGALLALVRHEGADGGFQVSEVLAKAIRPLFDAIVERIVELQDSGVVRKELDPRHLCVSVIALVAFPYQEVAFHRALWPVDWSSAEMVAARRQAIVGMIEAQMSPVSPAGG